MAYADALRGYISGLRTERGVSQEAVADVMGIVRRTYIAWETGDTKDIKTPLVVRAIKFLGGALDHLGFLENATEEEARRFASEWVRTKGAVNPQDFFTEPKIREIDQPIEEQLHVLLRAMDLSPESEEYVAKLVHILSKKDREAREAKKAGQDE